MKRLAFEAHDSVRELEFYAQEIRSRRFWHDQPFGRGKLRFWLGWFYGGFADFGRSFARPVLAWLILVAMFAALYLALRNGGLAFISPSAPWSATTQFANAWAALSSPCTAGTSTAWGEALYLSFRSALLHIDWADTTTTNRVFGCLYGFDRQGHPIVPLPVSAASLAQAVISGGFIALFLVALRNLIKMR